MNMGIVWLVWLLVIIGSFAAFETYAIRNNRTTLSRWTWTVSKAWPPFPCLFGLIVGFLICHFWWGGIVCFAPVATIAPPDIHHVVCLDGSQKLLIANTRGVCPL